MNSDGLSIPQSHSAQAKSTVQHGGREEGMEGRLSLLLHSYSLGVVLVCCVLLIIYNLYHPKVPLHAFHPPAHTHDGGCRLGQTDLGELATLCLLSGDVGCRLAPYHAFIIVTVTRTEPVGGAKPLEESFLPREEAKAEETAGPRSRVSGDIRKKGCSVHGSQPH